MLIVRSLQELKYDPNSIVTVGTFDGVHRGHQLIIKDLLDHTRSNNGRSVVVTFEPHPREVVGKGPVALLSTLDERLAIMKDLGVNVAVVVEFTFEFSRKTSREFYEQYLLRCCGIKEVIVGYDHMFGRDRKTNVDELRRMGEEYRFGVTVVSPVSVDGEIVSSTKIRNLLLRGNVELTAQYLNRPYSLTGAVVVGDRRGVTLGFPTANVEPKSANKMVPADGVYFVSVEVDKRAYYGMLNIGVRPTFQTELRKIIEVNIFDINENLYGKELTLYFLKRVRSEKKFSSKEELITQLQTDRSLCLKFIKEIHS